MNRYSKNRMNRYSKKQNESLFEKQNESIRPLFARIELTLKAIKGIIQNIEAAIKPPINEEEI